MSFRILISLFLLFFPVFSAAQSLSVNVRDHAAGSNVFQLEAGAVSVNSSGIRFLASGKRASGFAAYGISPDLSVVGTIVSNYEGTFVTVYNSAGDTLVANAIHQVSEGDPSLALYPLNTGEVLVRDNINRFNGYDTFGNRIIEVSSSSQSEEGEVISEVASDPAGKTTVIYNPKIRRNGGLGSRARILDPAGSLQDIYFSNKCILKQVKVSGNGQFIALVTASEGSADEVIFIDRYGNELNRIQSDEDLAGVQISPGAGYLTLYSTRRVLVYEALSGERVGSTSFRSSLYLAAYFPNDNVIIGLAGEYFENSGILNNAEFHAIHLGKRQLARHETGAGMVFNSAISPRLVRTSAYSYRLLGTNKEINIRADF